LGSAVCHAGAAIAAMIPVNAEGEVRMQRTALRAAADPSS
jgi:hypothetical protein